MPANREIALLRLAAQRIVGPGFGAAGEVVRHLTAMQGQDLPGAMISTALRTTGRDRSLVVDALNSGEVVRSWPMRGTLHLVPAEDLRWMLELTSARIVKGATRRRAELGLDEDKLARAEELAVESLSGGRALRREELLAVWEREGLLGQPGRGYHLLFNLAQHGVLCFGPYDGVAQSVVLLDEWVPNPRRLGREEALGEWALRYFRGHGPATVKDFAWWTKTTQSDIKVGLGIARPHLESMTADGVEYLMDPRTPDLLAAHRADATRRLLLPGFDEFMLGYGDRSAALPAEHAQQVVPGNNGMFRGTVVSDGRIVGTWKRGGTARSPEIDAMPFETFTRVEREMLSKLFLALP